MTKVRSALRICKTWQKGPAVYHCGPHPFYILFENRKLGRVGEKERKKKGERKWEEGKGGAPHLLEGRSSCFSASADTFTLGLHSRPASAVPRPLNTATPKPGMASPGPDLQISLLHPGREVCVTVVWSHVPPPLGCTSGPLHTVCLSPRGSFAVQIGSWE